MIAEANGNLIYVAYFDGTLNDFIEFFNEPWFSKENFNFDLIGCHRLDFSWGDLMIAGKCREEKEFLSSARLF